MGTKNGGAGGTVDVARPKAQRKTKKPPLYRVLLHNDNYTTMEFVVHILTTVFHRSHTEAVEIMLRVHMEGTGTAGIYPFEIAESRIERVHRLAREAQYPLMCSMEPA